MKFTLFYENREEIRNKISEIIPRVVASGMKFDSPVNTEFFAAKPHYPYLFELNALPLKVQVEEVEFDGSGLSTLRKRIYDQ